MKSASWTSRDSVARVFVAGTQDRDTAWHIIWGLWSPHCTVPVTFIRRQPWHSDGAARASAGSMPVFILMPLLQQEGIQQLQLRQLIGVHVMAQQPLPTSRQVSCDAPDDTPTRAAASSRAQRGGISPLPLDGLQNDSLAALKARPRHSNQGEGPPTGAPQTMTRQCLHTGGSPGAVPSRSTSDGLATGHRSASVAAALAGDRAGTMPPLTTATCAAGRKISSSTGSTTRPWKAPKRTMSSSA